MLEISGVLCQSGTPQHSWPIIMSFIKIAIFGGYTMFQQTHMLEKSCTLTFLKILGVKRCSIEVLRFMHALLCSLRI